MFAQCSLIRQIFYFYTGIENKKRFIEMTEQDVLRRQETNGQKEFYLMLIGQFYHAYGHGAFALARATGYRVMRKQRKNGEILTVGFPANCMDRVKARILENRGQIRDIDGKTLLFCGIDGTPDMSLVQETATEVPIDADSCLSEVLAFNLSCATPIDTMNFLNQLQKKYGSK